MEMPELKFYVVNNKYIYFKYVNVTKNRQTVQFGYMTKKENLKIPSKRRKETNIHTNRQNVL